jgi:hypothetical protein
MSKFRYVAIAPGRADGKHVDGMGKAVFLHDFLIDHQTDEAGRVQYGRLITYAWIRERFKNPPPLRTLQRWMARLRDAGYIDCTAVSSQHGMRVRVLNQKKWPAKPMQGSLFSPEPRQISSGKVCEKPVKKPSSPGTTLPPKVAAASRQKWRSYSLGEEKNEETIKSAVREISQSHSVENPRMSEAEIEKRRQFLLDQADQLKRKFKIS